LTIKLFAGLPPIPGNAEDMPLHDARRFRAAAVHARRIYPGPIGELVYRELDAYAEFGHRLGDDGLILRLAAAVLDVPSDPRPEDQTPGRRSEAVSPAGRHSQAHPVHRQAASQTAEGSDRASASTGQF